MLLNEFIKPLGISKPIWPNGLAHDRKA